MKRKIILNFGTERQQEVVVSNIIFLENGLCRIVHADTGVIDELSADGIVLGETVREITNNPVETNKPEYDWGTWDVEKHVNDTNKLREADTANPGGGN